MTDNRTNEPTAEQIVRGVRKLLNRYSLRGDVPCDEIDKLIDDSEAGLLSEGTPSEALIAEAKRRARKRRGAGWLEEADMLDRLISALEAAGVASQEVIDDAADEQDDLRMHMLAPQEPNQNETKSGNNFVSLDAEKVAEVLLANAKSRYGGLLFEERAAARIARALCEAYTEGKLTK